MLNEKFVVVCSICYVSVDWDVVIVVKEEKFVIEGEVEHCNAFIESSGS
ncbi:MAG: hypothetical protein ACLUDU_14665 [Butyricimonas faecihominis]